MKYVLLREFGLRGSHKQAPGCIKAFSPATVQGFRVPGSRVVKG